MSRSSPSPDRGRIPSRRGFVLVVAALAALVPALAGGATHPGGLTGPGRWVVSLLFALSAGGGAVAVRRLVTRVQDRVLPRRRAIVVGDGPRAERVVRSLLRDRDADRLVVVGPGRERPAWMPENASWVAGEDSLADLPITSGDRVVVALEDRRNRLPVEELLRLRVAGVRVLDASRYLEERERKIELDLVRPSDLLFCRGFVRTSLRLAGKRALDIGCSLVLLLACLPLFVVLPLAIWLEDGGPVFYRQRRVGLGGRTFEILKFRSMRVDAEADGTPRLATHDDPRTTRVGRFLRRFRLDELPQLINVLRGEMSLVGPRPERPEFVRRYERKIPLYALRATVRPGLTGWAQVQYGYASSDLDAKEKLKYDLFYVKHLGPLFDLEILLRTVRVVLAGDGAR